MNALARRIFNVFGEDTGVTDQDVQAGVAEREELLDAVTSAGYDGSLARGLGTSQLRELARILGEIRNGEIAVPSRAGAPADNDGGMEADQFDEDSDRVRLANDHGPQRMGTAKGTPDVRGESRRGWSKWQDISDKTAEQLFHSDDLTSKLPEAEQKLLATKLEDMNRRGFQRATPPMGSGIDDGRRNSSQMMSFSEKQKKSRLDRFWQKNRSQLEKFGETYASWAAVVGNATAADAAKLLTLK